MSLERNHTRLNNEENEKSQNNTPAEKTFTFLGYSLKKQVMLTCTSTTKPSLNVPLKTKFREVPTKN